ncbi:MAG: hypothetical protein N3D85_06900 [Candidatus Bathyarchaeota archaeon]|nr:hypothetical protein [Candidatus Bathyarchaeota archaeon]
MMALKHVSYRESTLVVLAIAFVLTLVFSPFSSVNAKAEWRNSEYENFVYTRLNSPQGNVTIVEKPMFPVHFNESQISIGSNWSIVVPLVANHTYHVYCYGEWVHNGSAPKTDYDIYVYNPEGIQESEHTEAAGLPEHLGSRVNHTFFVPQMTGNYTFVIENDIRQSNGTQAATFMIIENLETNRWHSRYIEGKTTNQGSTFNTSWAYEFVTDKANIEIWIKVPHTLDMYEARLYAMSDAHSLVINNMPLPWEPGLYGNLTNGVGGYNLDSEKYRGVAYASCEFRGQDMFLNFSANNATKTLYHLVLIGESGAGEVEFLIKTQFENGSLIPAGLLGRVYPTNSTTITYISNFELINAVLEYTTDSWNSSQSINMNVTTKNCTAVIPPQRAGTVVEYRVLAKDILMNSLVANGSYTVKQSASLNITSVSEKAHVGENVTIQGMLVGLNSSVPLTIQIMSAAETYQVETRTMANGTFSVVFQPNSTGTWVAQATFSGNDLFFACDSNQVMIKINEQPFIAKNGIYVGGGFIGAIAVSGVVYFIRKRKQ